MDGNKRTAAMAAVYAYITDVEAQARQAADSPEIRTKESCGRRMLPGPGPNIWGLTGRQFMMQANTMMQLRMFK